MPQPIDPNDVIQDTPTGKQVDPSDVVQDQPQQAGLFTRMGRALETPFVDLLGTRQGAESISTGPGMNRSPLEAQLRGFTTGAMEAVTPAHLAAVLSLGTGAPAVAGNAALAAQGVGQATDPSLSKWQRIAGGASGVAGGAGALSGIGKVLRTEGTLSSEAAGLPKSYTVEPTMQPGGALKTREPWNIRTSGKPLPVPVSDVVQDATPHIPYSEPTPYNPSEQYAPNVGSTPDRGIPQGPLPQSSVDQYAPSVSSIPDRAVPQGPLPTSSIDQYAPSVSSTPDRGIPQEPLPTPTPIGRYAPNVGAEPLPQGFNKAGTLADVAYPEQTEPYPIEPDRGAPYVPPAFRNTGMRQDIAEAAQQAQQSEPENPESWKPFVQQTNEARADAASMGHPAEAVSPEAQASGVEPIAPAEEQPGSSKLLQILKTPGGAAGANYGAAQQAVKAGEIPSADAARASRLLTIPGREAEGQEILSNLGPNSTGAAKLPPPDVPAATAPEAKANLLQQLLSEQGVGGSTGSIASPLLTRVLGSGAGAAVGAPIGAHYDEDDPTLGALKGAIAGGLVGGWIAPTEGGGMGEAVNNFLNTRSASMLAGPSPVIKKGLADPGGIVNEALLKLLTPGERQTGLNLLKEHPFIHPITFLKELKEGALSGEDTLGAGIGGVVGDIQHAQSGPLGLAGAPYKAIMNAYVKPMMRAGLSEEDAMKVVGSGVPETQTGQDWMRLHRNPLVRYLVPFAKLGTSMAEGARNIPGISMLAGNPENAMQRGAVGGLNMALGGLNELYSQSKEEEGSPISPLAQGAMAAAVGPKNFASYAAGKALTSMATQSPATALTELLRLIPGSTSLMPTRHAGESTDDYSWRVLTNVFGQMVPTIFSPGSGSTR